VDEPATYALISGIQVPSLISLWQNIVRPAGKLVMGITIIGIIGAWIIIRRNIKMEEVE
jgi:hypothetical protein